MDCKELKYFDNSAIPGSPDKPNAVPKDGQKNAMSRLTRMFSQSGRDKEKQKEVERKKQQQQEKLSVSPVVSDHQPHSGGTSPLPKHTERDGEYSSDTDNAPSRGSSVAGDHPKSRNVSAQHAKNGETAVVPFVRFEMLEDGVNHVHHLRATKRQEKLSTMLQSWLGGGKKMVEEEKPAPMKDQLSLMHSWINEVKTEKLVNAKKDGAATSATLVEKYGRCQEVIGRGLSPHPLLPFFIR